ncbi:MAG: photosynthetic reaction center cytochrome PufC [Acetobacteraceae bacterium]
MRNRFDLLGAMGWAATAVLGVVAVFVIVTSFERPPVDVVQWGYRGTAMELVYNPRVVAANLPRHAMPEPTEPIEKSGIPSREAYENVQVLGDLDSAEFLRLMTAITAWVSPQQGCNYCHNPENLADDSVYTKIVTRRMLQMTKTINDGWQAHVRQTGVTCYTCHRGQPVPAYVWGTDPPENQRRTRGLMASAAGQNIASPVVGQSSLPNDPFTPFFLQDNQIRVNTTSGPMSLGDNRMSIKQTEWTYALMFHFSAATGANCTFCHNSQNFGKWESSTPQRLNAWHGIRMVRELNVTYIEPLTPLWARNPQGPPEAGAAANVARLGIAGDALKVNCLTCHQGAHKPMLGAQMLANYPELNAVSQAPINIRAALR